MASVLIVEDVQRRANWLAKNFDARGAEVWLWTVTNRATRYGAPRQRKSVEVLRKSSWTLVMAHGSLVAPGSTEGYLPLPDSRRLLTYSTRDSDPSPEFDVLTRGLASRGDMPNEDEAKELLDYAEGKTNVIPSLLRGRPSVECAGALSLLCQGYLASHFPKSGDLAGLESAVRDAFGEMGWTDFLPTPEGKQFSRERHAKRRKTERPGWWQEVLPGRWKKLVAEQKRVVRKALKDEEEDLGRFLPKKEAKGLSLDKALLFVDGLFERRAPILKHEEGPERVAEAYLQLAAVLKKAAR